MKEQRRKSTWLMSYADLFTLLLTAFLLSVVLINEMENSLTMIIENLHKQGLIYLDGEKFEKYIDENGNGKYDKGENFTDCDEKERICSDNPKWSENMGNGDFDEFYLDGEINNKSTFLDLNINTPISISNTTQGLQLTIPGDRFFRSGKAEIEKNSYQPLCEVGKIVSNAIQFKYIQTPQRDDTLITYYTIDSLKKELSLKCQRIVEKIRVEGHTDNTPISKKRAKQWYNQTNLRLSSARALSVVEFWSSNECNRYDLPIQLEEEWFTTVGIGEFSPIADNSTSSGQRKNRRVEVFIAVNIEIDSTIMINDEMTCKDFLNKEVKEIEEKSFFDRIFNKNGSE